MIVEIHQCEVIGIGPQGRRLHPAIDQQDILLPRREIGEARAALVVEELVGLPHHDETVRSDRGGDDLRPILVGTEQIEHARAFFEPEEG